MCTVLQFSGGKDSLACLYLLEEQWDSLIVAWVNTGATFPETLALMERIREQVPDFREVKSSQSIRQRGYPVDMVPVIAGPIGEMTEDYRGPRFQSRYECCGHSLWAPLKEALKEWGATVVIRGQKRADARRIPLPNGAVVEGIEYRFPLEDWSDERVLAYLERKGVPLPDNYQQMSTGLDCWNCTAYLQENAGKLEYLERYPAWHREVRDVLDSYREQLTQSLHHLEAL